MKKTQFFELMGDIDENKLVEADSAMRNKKRITWMPYAVSVACAAIVIGLGIPAMNNALSEKTDIVSEQSGNQKESEISKTEVISKEENKTNVVTEYMARIDNIVVNQADRIISADMDVEITDYNKKIPESVWNEILAEFGERIGTDYYSFIAKLPDTWGFPKFFSYATRGYKDAMLEGEYKIHDYVFECTPEEGKRAVIAMCPDEMPLTDVIIKKDVVASDINGVSVIVYGTGTDHYRVEFEYDGVYFRVETEKAPLEELAELITALTSEPVSEQEEKPADESGIYMEAVDSESLTDSSAEIFCGSYIDNNGAYNVLLTADTPENRALICKEIGISEDDAKWSTAKYTHKYLTELQTKISDAMINKELPFVVSSGVYENLNRIIVGVTTKNEDDIAKVLALDTIGGAIQIEYSEENFIATLEAEIK